MPRNEVDTKVVSMRFDNKNFEKNVNESLKTIDKLDKSLKLKGIDEGFNNMEKAASKVDLTPLANAAQTVGKKFTAMEVVAITALQRLTNSVINTVSSIYKQMSVLSAASAGWDKYADKTSSVQTIMAATKKQFEDEGEQMEYVNEQLDKLNWYTDETSYNFVDMVRNIGSFTTKGIKLDTAVTAMQGIANWAAISGVNAQKASLAMDNLSQAMGMGKVIVRDWDSIERVNMDTVEFKEAAMEAAYAAKLLKKNADGTYKTLKGTAVTVANFRTTLNEGWLTSQVLMDTLALYGGATDRLYEISLETGLTASDLLQAVEEVSKGTFQASDYIDDCSVSAERLTELMADLSSEQYEFGLKALRAGQEAKTFQEAIDSVKDAASTTWAKIWEIIFGDYERARKLWTKFANFLFSVFVDPLVILRDTLKGWEKLGLFNGLFAMLERVGPTVEALLSPIKEAFSEIFGLDDLAFNAYKKIFSLIHRIDDLLTNINTWLENGGAKKLRDTFVSFFKFVKSIGNVLGSLYKNIIKPIAKTIINSFKSVFTSSEGVNSLFDSLSQIFNTIADNLKISDGFLNILGKTLTFIFKIIKTIGSIVLWLIRDVIVPAQAKIFEVIDAIEEKLNWFKDHVVTPVSDSIKGALDKSGISSFFSTIKNSLKNIGKIGESEDYSETGKDMIGGINEGVIETGKKTFGKTAKAVGTKWLDEFKKFFGIHSPSLRTYKELGVPMAKGEILGYTETMESAETSEELEDATEEALSFGTKFVNLMTKLFATIGKAFNTFSLQPVINGFNWLKKTVIDLYKKAADPLGKALATLAEGIDKLKEALSKFFGDFTLKNILQYAQGITRVVLGFNLSSFLKALTDTQWAVYGITKAVKRNVQANNFKIIAKGVLIMAAGIALLIGAITFAANMMDKQQMNNAIIMLLEISGILLGLTVIIGGLVLIIAKVSKTLPATAVLATTIIGMVGVLGTIAGALILFIGAIYLLSLIDPEKVKSGLESIDIFFRSLGPLLKDALGIRIGNGKTLLGLAALLIAVIAPILVINKIGKEAADEAIYIINSFIFAIAGVLAASRGFHLGGIIVLGIITVLLFKMIKTLKDIKFNAPATEEILKKFVALMLFVINKLGGMNTVMLAVASIALLAMGVFLSNFAGIMEGLSSIENPFGALATLGGMALVIIAFGSLLELTKRKKGEKIGGAVFTYLALSVLLLALGSAVSKLAEYSWDQLIAPFVGIIGVIGALGVLMITLKTVTDKDLKIKNGGSGSFAFVLAALSLFLYALTPLVKILASYDGWDIVKAFSPIVAIVGILALFMKEVSKIPTSGAVTMGFFLGIVAVIGGIFVTLSAMNADPNKVLEYCYGIIGVILALSVLAMFLSKANINIQKNITKNYSEKSKTPIIIMLIELAAIFAEIAALTVWLNSANVTDQTLKAMGILSGIVAGIAVLSVAIVKLTQKGQIKKFKGAQLTVLAYLGALTAVMAGLAGIAIWIQNGFKGDNTDLALKLGIITIAVVALSALSYALARFAKDISGGWTQLLTIVGYLAALELAMFGVAAIAMFVQNNFKGTNDDLITKLGIITIAVGLLAGIATLLSKFGEANLLDMGAIVLGLAGMVASMFLLALAIKQLDGIDTTQMWNAVGALSVLMALLGVIAGVFAGIGTATGGLFSALIAATAAGMLIFAGAAIIFAEALRIIADALEKLTKFKAEDFKDFEVTLDAIKDLISAIIVGLVDGVIDGLIEFTNRLPQIKAEIQKHLDDIVGAAGVTGEALALAIGSFSIGALRGLRDPKTGLPAVVSEFTETYVAVEEALEDEEHGVPRILKAWYSFQKAFIGAVADKETGLPSVIPVFNAMLINISDAVGDEKTGLPAVIKSFGNMCMNILAELRDPKTGTKAIVSEFGSWLGDIVGSIPKAMANLAEGLINGVIEALTTAGRLMPTKTGELRTAIGVFLKGLFLSIEILLLGETGAKMLNGFVGALWTGVKAALNSVFDKTDEELKKEQEEAKKEAERIAYQYQMGFVQGLAPGQKLTDTAIGLGSHVTETVANTLREKSPSRVAMEQGRFYDEGLAIGLEMNQDKVKDAAEGTGDSVSQGVSNATPTVSSAIDELVGGFKDSITEKFNNTADDTTNTVSSFIGNVMEKVSNNKTIRDAGAVIKDKFMSLFEDVDEVANQVLTVSAVLDDQQALDELNNLSSTMDKVGVKKISVDRSSIAAASAAYSMNAAISNENQESAANSKLIKALEYLAKATEENTAATEENNSKEPVVLSNGSGYVREDIIHALNNSIKRKETVWE